MEGKCFAILRAVRGEAKTPGPSPHLVKTGQYSVNLDTEVCEEIPLAQGFSSLSHS